MFITLAGTNTDLPSSVEFCDDDFNIINRYTGTTQSLTAGIRAFVPLCVNNAGTGNLTRVAGIQFIRDGGGNVDVLVEGIAAAATPAPSITSASWASGRVGTPFSDRDAQRTENKPEEFGAPGTDAACSLKSLHREFRLSGQI